MNALNESQQAAVRSTATTVYVIAGPGSGKTKTMVERINARVDNGVDSRRIAIMTFTNAGAAEFTKRLAPLQVGYAGTLHGFCLRLLQRHGHLIGYRKGGVTISILPEKEREEMIKAARDAIGLTKRITMKKVMEFKDIVDVMLVADGQNKADARLAWRAYGEALKRNNMVDYDKLLAEGLRLLALDAVRSSLHIDELYVDEAQDSGDVDWNIIAAMQVKVRFIVGDPDQSIYAFRGGDPTLLVNNAMNPSPGIWTTYLEQNYRSDVLICEAATRLIQHNTNRLPKCVVATTNAGGLVEQREFATDAEEANFVFTALWGLAAQQRYPYGEMAVLTRTNAVAMKLRNLLAAFGLPLKRPAAIAPPFGWHTACLLVSLAVDPANDLYAEKVLTGKEKHAAAIAKKSLAEFSGMVFPSLIVDVPSYLARNNAQRESIAAVETIIAGLPAAATLPDLLSAMHDPDAFRVEDAQDGVTVSTIHGAKGREWDVVVIAGCEEGTLPTLKDGTDVEEERRLMFVAVTRARHILLLTTARRRTGEKPWETRENLKPSRFLAEIL